MDLARGKILSARRSPKSQTRLINDVSPFEHYLSKSGDRFYRSGYNLLCSNISGRRNICHSVRAPLCWQRSPRSRGWSSPKKPEWKLDQPVERNTLCQSDHNRPCRQIRGSGGQLWTLQYYSSHSIWCNNYYIFFINVATKIYYNNYSPRVGIALFSLNY